MTDTEKAVLRSRIDDSPDSATSLILLKEVRAATAAGHFTEQEEIELSLSALSRLRRQTRTEGVFPRSAIVEYALPLGIKHFEDEETRFSLYSLRELIGEWINEMPSEWAFSLCEECVALLIKWLKRADAEHLNPICWMIGDVGYRNAAVVAALEEILSSHDDKVGDVALGTLVTLGATGEHRDRYLAIAQARAKKSRNNSIEYVLGTLADSSTIDLLLADWVTKNVRDVLLAVVSILGHMAKSADDPIITRKVSDAIVAIERDFGAQLGNSLLIRGDILPECDSAQMVELLLKQLNFPPNAQTQEHGVLRMVIIRLLACWQPAQLRGCDAPPSESALAAIKNVLLATEAYDGRNLTPLNHLREYLVSGLLRLGRPEILAWYPEILAVQKNPYSRHEFLRTLALFQFDDFPPEILTLITDIVDLKPGKDDPELLVRLSASRLVRSSGNRKAFEVLLKPGLTFNGSVMRDTVEALADVALALSEEPLLRDYVVSELLKRLREETSDPIESSVCRALNALALAGRLRSDEIEGLAKYLAKPIVESRLFVKGLVVQAIGTFPKFRVPAETVGLIIGWAQERNDWLGWRSIEALIQWEMFAELRAWLPDKLGLSRENEEWSWSPSAARSCSYASSFIVMLYEKTPADFAQIVAKIVQADSWEAADRATLTLVTQCQAKGTQVRSEVARALIEKAKRRNRPNSADTAVISYLPYLCPDEFSGEAWQEVWGNWTDDARAALADAFGALNKPSAQTAAVPMLLQLVHDTHFGVRRAAARSLVKVDDQAFHAESERGMRSPVIDDRRRAAESIPWLRDAESVSEIAQHLANDSMLSVRDAAKASLEYRKRRDVAKTYLAKLTSIGNPSQTETLAVIRYGQALAEIGDDETLSELNSYLENATIASRARMLIIRVSKELESKWRSQKQKWPQPLSETKGSLKSGSGQILLGLNQVAVDYKLWHQLQAEIGAPSRWGGTALVQGPIPSGDPFRAEAFLVLTDSYKAKVTLLETFSSTQLNTVRLEFQGVGDYPAGHI